jgi:hypothetical protein
MGLGEFRGTLAQSEQGHVCGELMKSMKARSGTARLATTRIVEKRCATL